MHHPSIPESGLKMVMLLPPGSPCVATADTTWGWSPDAGVLEACLAGDGSGVVMDTTDMLLKEPTLEPMEEVSLKAMGWLAMADADNTWGWSPDAGVLEACLACDGSGVAMDTTDMLLIEPTREAHGGGVAEGYGVAGQATLILPGRLACQRGTNGAHCPPKPAPVPVRRGGIARISFTACCTRDHQQAGCSVQASGFIVKQLHDTKLVQLCVTASYVNWHAASKTHSSLQRGDLEYLPSEACPWSS